jgi:toxin YoeB
LGLIGIYSTPFVEASSEGKKIVLDEKEDKKEEEKQPLKASSLFLGCFDEPSFKKEKDIPFCKTANYKTTEDLLADKIREENRVHYEKCASWGNPYGMNALGYLYANQVEDLLKQEESQENAEKIVSLAHEAAQWHLLAFETYWLTKKGTYSDSAFDGLDELSTSLKEKYTSKNKKYNDIRFFKKGLLEIIENINNLYKNYTKKDIEKIADKYKNAFQFNGVNGEESLLKYYMFKTYVDPELTGQDLLGREKDSKKIEISLRYKKAKQCFKKSGTPHALYNLGLMYENGCIQCENPYKQAAEYYKKSKTPMALFNLGILYHNKHIESKNLYEDAKKCFEQSKTPNALYGLGLFYYEKHIESENPYEEAKKYWEKSGTPDALNNLGMLYYDQKSYKTAQEYWEKSGTPDALNNLGMLYYDQKSYKTAQEYWEKSGTPDALNNLGMLYMNGHIKKSLSTLERYELALKYFQDALIGGYQKALKFEEDCQKLIDLEKEVNKKEKNLNSENNDTNNVIEETKSSSSDEEKDKQEEKKDDKHESTNIGVEKTEEKVLEPKKKKTKEEIQEEKKQKKILELEKAKTKRDKTLEKMKEKFSLDKKLISSGINEAKPMRITFIDEKMREKFLEVRGSEMGDKLQELIDDIKKCPWGLQGTGFSEVLKNDRSGQFSRRINDEDRLIYIPTENGIKILDCQGHYE